MSFENAQLVVIGITLVAALVNGGMGYGFSSISVPVLLMLYPGKVLSPALVTVELLLNAVAIFSNREALPRVWRPMLPLLLGVLPGVVFGAWVLSSAPSGPLKLVTFTVLLPLIVLQSAGLRWPLKLGMKTGIPLGAGVGVLYSVTTISGPPLALLLNNQGFTRDDFRAGLSLFRIVESTVTALVYWKLGLFSVASSELAGTMLLPVLIGCPVGTFLLRRLPPETFRRITMSTDALLVAFSLTRAAELAPVWAGTLGVAVAVFEAVILFRYFSAKPREVKVSRFAMDFPIALRLEDRPALVVGGGKVAEGRVAHLLEAHARVTVVAPEVTELIGKWASDGLLKWVQREVEARDFEEPELVLTATDRREATVLAAAEAKKRRALFNAADVPELCDFFVPSIGRRGPVTVAVSTAGQAPALARHVRAKAMEQIGPGYALLARVLGRLRRRLPKGPERNALLQRLIDGGAAELLERRDVAAVRQLAQPQEGKA